MSNNYALQIHFDGYIATDHLASMRTLGKTLSHLQSAIDRACIDITYGNLRKGSRMPQNLWKEAELLVGPSHEGGYIVDFFIKNEKTRLVLERVNSAIKSAVEKMTSEGIERTKTLAEEVTQREIQISRGLVKPLQFSEAATDPRVVRTYADRAIVRELDQVLSIIRSSAAKESSFEVTLATQKPMRYSFTKREAILFHETVALREVGLPLVYQAKIRSLDKGTLSGKVFNIESKRQSNLYFTDEIALLKLVPYFERDELVTFFGSPWIEYGAFDPGSGDILFIDLTN